MDNTGDLNTAVGSGTLSSNTTDGGNTAVGYKALFENIDGLLNTAVGSQALPNNNTGVANTAIGGHALINSAAGTDNTAVGFEALFSSTGNANTALGAFAGGNVTTASNVICIGSSGADVDDGCYIGNIWQQTGGSQAVYVNASGKLGAQVSSRRFKDEIKPMEQASELIYRLKPVTFRYKSEIEPTRPVCFGLIAEEVEKINPDLVARDKEGKPYSVRYDQVNAMLLNEFLKEHRKVEQQARQMQQQCQDFEAAIARQREDFEITISELKKKIEAVVAYSKEQDANIQRVSAQIELNRPGARIVDDKQ